jgi:hypothetical protein
MPSGFVTCPTLELAVFKLQQSSIDKLARDTGIVFDAPFGIFSDV